MPAYQPGPDSRTVTITAVDLLILTSIAVDALAAVAPGESRDNLGACIVRVLSAEKQSRTAKAGA